MSRYDEALLRIQLSNMPLGHYHAKDTPENVLYRDGIAVAIIDAGTRTAVDGQKSAGLIAALVHLLNAREQTDITNGTKP